MWARIGRRLRQFFRKSRTINNEPLNKVSLIVIILIDIFILINVFAGLDDISRWHLSPTQAYPCYSDFQNYRSSKAKDKDYQTIRNSFNLDLPNRNTWRQNYQSVESGHLGKVFPLCLEYADRRDRVNNPRDREIIKTIDRQESQVNSLSRANQNIRSQYDSTLLEKIAGQQRDRSINSVSAEKAKQELERNNQNISQIQQEITKLKSELLAKPSSIDFLNLLKDDKQFGQVESNYKQAAFWYPSIQLVFQALFLIPLIILALLVHNFSQHQGYGLIALLSWHLLVVFLIPLILKIFEFLQVGVLFNWIFNLISAIFGSLLFLVSYVYILLIPLVGFGIIKLFQNKFIFNAKIQAAQRLQASCCMRCGRKLQPQDSHCPHCGYYQYLECPNCHSMTYKNLPYCKECGSAQESSLPTLD